MKAQATPEKGGPRINRDIRANKVQLIDAEGQNRGIVEIAEAQQLADEAALDLVEIVPNAEPPVCKILDFGKFRFLEQKKSAAPRQLGDADTRQSGSRAAHGRTPDGHGARAAIGATILGSRPSRSPLSD